MKISVKPKAYMQLPGAPIGGAQILAVLQHVVLHVSKPGALQSVVDVQTHETFARTL